MIQNVNKWKYFLIVGVIKADEAHRCKK